MSAIALPAPASRLRVDVLAIEREDPDTERSHRAHGIAMVEAFALSLPDGTQGRCWIPTAEAMAIEAFGRGWVARALRARLDRIGDQALAAELGHPSGCRLAAADAPGDRGSRKLLGRQGERASDGANDGRTPQPWFDAVRVDLLGGAAPAVA
jgi:hypothetical protein